MGSLLATGNIPTEVLEGLDGGVRGIVVGDIVRRYVARSIAKQIAKKVEQATSPFHYALSAKAGSDCVAHVLTDVDAKATVGFHDQLSRNSMMRGLRRMEDETKSFLFCAKLVREPIYSLVGRRNGHGRGHCTRKGRGTK